MQKLHNLRLAVRLGIAFGALALGLAIVATVAFVSADSTHSSIDTLVNRSVRATALVADLEIGSHDIAHGVSQHLYVFDGDIKHEDKIQHDIVFLRDANTKAFNELAKLVQDTPAADELEAYGAACDTFRAAYLKAVAISRKETLAGAENRDRSRSVYLEQVVPALEKLETTSGKLTAGLDRQLDDSAAHTVSSAGAAKRNIVIVALIALFAAIALAVWITRSVTRPVHALSARLQSINDNCLVVLSDGLVAVSEGDLTKDATPVTTPVDIQSGDEIGQLSRTFNEMLAKTQRSLEAYNAMRTRLSATISEVSSSAGTVSAASQQMAATSGEAGRAIEEIASAVTDVANGAETQVRVVESARGSAAEAARAAGVSAGTASRPPRPPARRATSLSRASRPRRRPPRPCVRSPRRPMTSPPPSRSSPPARSASAASSTRSPASRSRPTCSR